MITLEVIGSTKEQRDIMRHAYNVQWERLDKDTYNVSIDDKEVDLLTDCLDDTGLEWRLV